MVSLKYSVGTANKFGGLNIDTDSSEDEATNLNLTSQLSSASSPPLINNSFISNADDNLSLHGEKKLNTAIDQEINQTTSSSNTTQRNKENLQTNRVKGNNTEKAGKFKTYEKVSEQSKFRKEGTTRQSYTSNEGSNTSHEKKNNKSSVKENPVETIKNEEKLTDSKTIEKEKVADLEEAKKQPLESKSSDPIMMDLEEWKSKQATKRANLPTASSTKPESSDFSRQLEAQGLTRYVKVSDNKTLESTFDEQTQESTAPKKKSQTMTYHELIYNATGQVKLFQGYKGRGRRNPPRGQKFERSGKEKQVDYKERDAPDFQDSRAFPTLGDAKVAS